MNIIELRYLNNSTQYLKHVFKIWGKYFNSRKDFNSFFNSIPVDSEKDLFLRVGSFYRFLVVEGRFRFSVKNWNTGMSYIDETYKYISIFSLVEALYAPPTYQDFYQWKQKNKKAESIRLDEKPTMALSRMYSQYKLEHGATQAAVKFFSALDQKDQNTIQTKLRISKKSSSIKELAQLLYDIRSQFVHQSRLVLGFGNKTSVGINKKGILINDLTIPDLQVLFEHGFLKRFGFQGSTQPG